MLVLELGSFVYSYQRYLTALLPLRHIPLRNFSSPVTRILGEAALDRMCAAEKRRYTTGAHASLAAHKFDALQIHLNAVDKKPSQDPHFRPLVSDTTVRRYGLTDDPALSRTLSNTSPDVATPAGSMCHIWISVSLYQQHYCFLSILRCCDTKAALSRSGAVRKRRCQEAASQSVSVGLPTRRNSYQLSALCRTV